MVALSLSLGESWRWEASALETPGESGSGARADGLLAVVVRCPSRLRWMGCLQDLEAWLDEESGSWERNWVATGSGWQE